MNRAKLSFLVLFTAAAMPASAWAQGGIQYDKIEIKTDKTSVEDATRVSCTRSQLLSEETQ